MSRMIEALHPDRREHCFHPGACPVPTRIDQIGHAAKHMHARRIHDLRNSTAPIIAADSKEATALQLPPHNQLLNLDQPGYEAYCRLCDQILGGSELAPPQCLSFTSSKAGEGKTTTALNLAFAAAQSHRRRVLVVDANLGHPDVANRLGVPMTIGLGDVLIHGVYPAEAIHEVPSVGYSVLPARQMRDGGKDILGGRRMGVLLQDLKQSYDLIIVDAPHLSDPFVARLLSKFIDAVFLVVRMHRTRRQAVDGALRLLQEEGGMVRGCILTHDEVSAELPAGKQPEGEGIVCDFSGDFAEVASHPSLSEEGRDDVTRPFDQHESAGIEFPAATGFGPQVPCEWCVAEQPVSSIGASESLVLLDAFEAPSAPSPECPPVPWNTSVTAAAPRETTGSQTRSIRLRRSPFVRDGSPLTEPRSVHPWPSTLTHRDAWAANMLGVCGGLLILASILYLAVDVVI